MGYDFCYLSIISRESIPVTIWVPFIELSCLISSNNPTLKDPKAFAKEAALTKSFVTEAAVDVSRLAIAVHGSYGLMEDYAVSRIYRDLIIGEQVEGVADLQRVITASLLLG